MNCNGDFYSVFARKRSDRSNPFLRKSLENTKATELSKRFLSNEESFKDSSDSIESNHNMDCHSPKGLRNDDSIGDSAESHKDSSDSTQESPESHNIASHLCKRQWQNPLLSLWELPCFFHKIHCFKVHTKPFYTQ